ncbi:hypothetical protein [Streptomyces sp. NPDC055709]
MTDNAESRQFVAGGSQEDLTAGGSETTVPQTEPTIDADDFVKLWADAKVSFLARDFPEYGSPAWRELHPDSPQRLAAALDAAEKWRKYGDDVTEWIREAIKPRSEPLHTRVEQARKAQAYQSPEPHQLQATPGWPAVRIPGGNGRYLAYIHDQRQEAA